MVPKFSKKPGNPYLGRLSFKLTLRTLGAAACLGVVFSLAQMLYDYSSQRMVLDREAEQILQTSVKTAVHIAWNLDAEGAGELLSGILKFLYVVKAEIIDEGGRTLAAAQRVSKSSTFKVFGDVRMYSRDLVIDGGAGDSSIRKNIGRLRITLDPSDLSQMFVKRSMVIVWVELLRNVVLMFVLLIICHWTLMRGLLQVSVELAGIDPENPGAHRISVLPAHATDELGSLADKANDLLQTVGENIRKRENIEAEILRINQGLENMVVLRTRELETALDDLSKVHEQLKQTQAAILQQDKMASIGLLAAGVAHEINNPMGFIGSNLCTLGKYVDRLSSFIELQSKTLELQDPALLEVVTAERKKGKIDRIIEDAQDLLGESLEGAERVRVIVQNLKNFSRVESDQSLVETDLNECLQSTVKIAWNEIKYKALVIEEYGDIPKIPCHPQQLNQVFLNLLVNAAHAIESSGEIRIRTAADDNSVWVHISDTGSGIDPEHLKKIFEPFFTTKPVGKGTGLGLSIAYDIVKKHGGKIEVESELGKGTCFHIRLPMSRCASEP